MAMPPSLHTLPDKALVHVATFLPHEKHIAAFACTCHAFNAAAKRAIHPTTLLLRACRWGDTATVLALLAAGRADPTARNHYTLRSSMEFGNAAVVTLLLADGRADPAWIDAGTIVRTEANGRAWMFDVFLRDPNLAGRIAVARAARQDVRNYPKVDRFQLWLGRVENRAEHFHPWWSSVGNHFEIDLQQQLTWSMWRRFIWVAILVFVWCCFLVAISKPKQGRP